MTDYQLGARSFIVWPVGCGDSVTVKLNDNVFMQVDLHHVATDLTNCNAVVDSLMQVLPEIEPGIRYLAVFVLSHAHLDHCQGFQLLLDKVDAGELRIGELWFSPRIFRDASGEEDLCADAMAFTDEALRRAKVVCSEGESAASGDRVRVIGSDDILDDPDFAGLPDRFKSRPGDVITVLDGVHFDESEFRAFLHSPFGDDSEGERNDTSVGMQITLGQGDSRGRLLLLGDLEAQSLQRIFDVSAEEDVAWDLLLAPHHCSRSALFEKDADGNYVLKADLVLAISDAASPAGRVLLSSSANFSDDPGCNPPHQMARDQYEAIAPNGVLCTAEYPAADSDSPIVFELTEAGLQDISVATPKPSVASVVKPFSVAAPRRRLIESPGG